MTKRSSPGRPSLRRHLAEFGFGVAALAALVPVAQPVLWPSSEHTGNAEAEPARPAVDWELPQPAHTDNTCRRGRVALTFDDGPDIYTRPLLKVLRAYRVRATFYVVGVKATRYPDLIRAEVADGHLVANHTWNHPRMIDLDRTEVRRQLLDSQRAIMAAGAPRPTLFRPPFGSTNALVNTEAAALGLRVVRWSIDTHDWRRGRTPDDIAAAVLDRAAPGSVVLMHDGLANSAATIQALPTIINGLRSRGFCTALNTE